MYFSQGRIKLYASEHFNPMQGLESPEDATKFTQPPIKMGKISDGNSKPSSVEFKDGIHGIGKSDGHSMANEQAAYELGRRLKLPVPATVRRKFPNETGMAIPHTVQQQVGGRVFGDIEVPVRPDKTKDYSRHFEVHAHPEYSKMALGDWLMGNGDRHENNFMWERNKENPDGRVHMIDNGEAFNFHHDVMPARHQNGNVTLNSNGLNAGHIAGNFLNAFSNPIPQDFRDAVMNADPEEHNAILDRIYGHSSFQNAPEEYRHRHGRDGSHYYGDMQPEDIKEYIKNGYNRRLTTLKNHFADPEVQTMGQLFPKIFY